MAALTTPSGCQGGITHLLIIGINCNYCVRTSCQTGGSYSSHSALLYFFHNNRINMNISIPRPPINAPSPHPPQMELQSASNAEAALATRAVQTASVVRAPLTRPGGTGKSGSSPIGGNPGLLPGGGDIGGIVVVVGGTVVVVVGGTVVVFVGGAGPVHERSADIVSLT